MRSRGRKTNDEVAVERGEVVREYGPFADPVHGVTFDGSQLWFATGEALVAVDPESGDELRSLPVAADAGTAFDGKYLYQLGAGSIRKLDPTSGAVVHTVPLPGEGYSGLTWAEGVLWLGHYGDRHILQIDPETGRVLRTLESDRYVTGVSWVDGELWHATWEGEASELRRVDPGTGEVLRRVELPDGTMVSGLEARSADLFYCGGGRSRKIRAVRRRSK